MLDRSSIVKYRWNRLIFKDFLRLGNARRTIKDGEIKGKTMTVCVAAMCRNFTGQLIVVGASDRMLTLDDHEWEPPVPKIYRFPSSVPVVAMTAGIATDQAAINEATHLHLYENPSASVREIAYLYAEKFAERRRVLAETKYLKPLGLTTDEFLQRQHGMASDLVLSLAGQLQYEELGAATLIVGMDQYGPHLYKIVDPGETRLHNSIGYAAVGYGARQAESVFMFAEYTSNWSAGRALYMAYAAKRRAEVAPGVGRTTDMFIMGGTPPAAPNFTPVPRVLVDHLANMFERVRQNALLVVETELEAFEKELKETITPSEPPPSQKPADKLPDTKK